MRGVALLLLALVTVGAAPPPTRAACADDYLTVETVRGTIIEIKPAPEPFKTADIFFSGPSPCDSMWMQVLKTDANPLVFRCKMVGGHGGSSGRYDVLKEVAYTTAFALDRMGIRE